MDRVTLGRRIAEARDLANMTQESVARAIGIDRTAVVLLEKGDRHLKVPELVRLAEVLGRPLSFFVEEPVPAAVSRRSTPHAAHDSTRQLDAEIDQFAIDLRSVARMGLLPPAGPSEDAHVPRNHDEAERAAALFRRRLNLESGPIDDLGRTCESFGLYTYAADLGVAGPDGACIQVEVGSGVVGAAVINGAAGSGRRRMTLAHELGHWLFGDVFDVQAPLDNEQMVNSFAIHFLAPRTGVNKLWAERSDMPLRDRALTVGVEYRLSWSATLGQLRNLDLVNHEQRDLLSRYEPKAGDYLRLGLSWADELAHPYLSPNLVAAVLRGYTAQTLTQAKTLELLRGILSVEELPDRDAPRAEDLRGAFQGHAGPRHGT